MSSTKKDRRARPLAGVRILVTRESSQAEELCGLLASLGARPIACPTIKFAAPRDWSPVDRSLSRLDRYDMLIFTSATAVRFFMQRALLKKVPQERFRALSVFAVGPQTARTASRYGLHPHPPPARHDAEGLLGSLEKKDLRSMRVLFPRAEAGREILPEGLRARGADVELVAVYRTLKENRSKKRLLEVVDTSGVDLAIFTSPSTVKCFVELIGTDRLARLRPKIHVACIGTVTAEAARAAGFTVSIVPRRQTMESLLRALTTFYGRKKAATTRRGSICRTHRNE